MNGVIQCSGRPPVCCLHHGKMHPGKQGRIMNNAGRRMNPVPINYLLKATVGKSECWQGKSLTATHYYDLQN